MATATTSAQHLTIADRMHVHRSRGALNGVLLVILGVWGGLVPFVGPWFHYAFTPADSWHFTMGRFWLEILPAVATIIGGLILLVSANRPTALFGGWLAALAGAWFVVGPGLSGLWNQGVSVAGHPASSDITRAALEYLGFFSGLGAVIIFLAAVSIGRMTVVSLKDVDDVLATDTDEGPAATRAEPRAHRAAVHDEGRDTTADGTAGSTRHAERTTTSTSDRSSD